MSSTAILFWPVKIHSWITTIAFWVVIIIGVSQFFGWVPYNFTLVKKHKIIPYMQQFPTQKVRLGLDTIEEVKRGDIDTVNWEIYNNGELVSRFDGLYPTIMLPSKGGIYNLFATAKVGGDIYKSNISNFYITQDEPTKVAVFAKSVAIDKNTLPINDKLMAFKGVYQLLDQNGDWKDLSHDSEGFIKIDSGATAKLYDGNVLIRPKDERNDLTTYDKIDIKSFTSETVKIPEDDSKR